MKNKHSNMGNANLPTYNTLKEIIVTGTKAGGDKKQYVFLDKNKQECERSFNQTWAEMSALGTYFSINGLNGKKKIAIIGENCYEWMITYYATLVGGNITVPMDCKLSAEDLADQLIRCDCDALAFTEICATSFSFLTLTEILGFKNLKCFGFTPSSVFLAKISPFSLYSSQ